MYCDSKSLASPKPRSSKDKKKNLPDITKNLNAILEMVSNSQDVSFSATTKSSRGLHNGTSSRRSQYIGVLGNGKRWQVLINVGKKKKYIGTYGQEKEAALVHDFYSIGLNGLNAKTNFSYNGEFIQEMITSFYENESSFDPARFLGRV